MTQKISFDFSNTKALAADADVAAMKDRVIAAKKTLVEKTGDDACKDYTEVVSSNEAVTWEGGSEGKWFVVKGDAAISEHITVTGTVTAAMVQTLMGVDKPMTTTAKSPVSIKIPVAVYRRFLSGSPCSHRGTASWLLQHGRQVHPQDTGDLLLWK